jgi:hypothetical protein
VVKAGAFLVRRNLGLGFRLFARVNIDARPFAIIVLFRAKTLTANAFHRAVMLPASQTLEVALADRSRVAVFVAAMGLALKDF